MERARHGDETLPDPRPRPQHRRRVDLAHAPFAHGPQILPPGRAPQRGDPRGARAALLVGRAVEDHLGVEGDEPLEIQRRVRPALVDEVDRAGLAQELVREAPGPAA